ncbi:MAG: CotH kinase family protein [Anaerolineae bacterium]|nr:CotH kinase family protein [Anaerolineae bacterium]
MWRSRDGWRCIPILSLASLLLCACTVQAPNRAGGGLVSHDPSPNQTLQINEVLACNRSTLPDPDYSVYSDWIEIYNPGLQEVNLQGFHLTDDLNIPTKWQVAKRTIVPPAGFALFWADRRDEGDHTSFSLNRRGEQVGLFSPDGVLLDVVSFEFQMPDVSFGRRPGTSSDWARFYPPSPRAANGSREVWVSTTAPEPRVFPQGGFYTEGQKVTLSAPSSAVTIHYTLDGSVPTGASPVYTSPIYVASTSVLRAATTQPGRLQSPIANHTYLIDEALSLPVVSVMTDPQNLWDDATGIYVDREVELRKGWERPAHIQLYEMDGDLGFSVDASIRLFGQTAIFLPQKSLAVLIRDADGLDSLHYPLFPEVPADEFRSFILRSSSDDWPRTMYRDAMAQEVLQGVLSLDTQGYRPAVMFLNGAYFGIHNIREKYTEYQIAQKHDLDPTRIDLLSLHIGYASGVETVEVLAGSGQAYAALWDLIAGQDMRLPENYAQVQAHVDVDSFIEYVIAQIYAGNTSWSRNRKVWRDRSTSGRWRFLLYDLDRGFEDPGVNLLEEFATYDPLFRALLVNPEFEARFVQRFTDHLNVASDPARVIPIIDRLQAAIAPEMPRHIARWKDECSPQCGIPSMEQWEGEVENLREYARQRPEILWQHLAQHFGSSGRAALVVDVFEPEGGDVWINGLPVGDGHGAYTVLKDTPVQLKAVPRRDYRFLGWRGLGEGSGSTSVILTGDRTITAMFAPVESPENKYAASLSGAVFALSLCASTLWIRRRRSSRTGRR